MRTSLFLSTFVSCCLHQGFALGQTAVGNPIQYWLDKSGQAYQAFQVCVLNQAKTFADQSCAAPSDIFEASLASCMDEKFEFMKAAASLEAAGYPAKLANDAYLDGLVRPNAKAAILAAQIQRSCN